MANVWRVEDQAECVLRARRAFRKCVARLSIPSSDVDAAELIYGELVANTVRHAKGRVEARLDLEDARQPVLTVRDHGPGLRCRPWNLQRDPYAESGRGLAIVELLARDLAVGPAEDGGTVVRAVLPITARRSTFATSS